MGRKGFSEEQIGVALRQVDAGTTVPEVCRKLGIAEATFYRWKRKYAGMGISTATDGCTRSCGGRTGR